VICLNGNKEKPEILENRKKEKPEIPKKFRATVLALDGNFFFFVVNVSDRKKGKKKIMLT